VVERVTGQRIDDSWCGAPTTYVVDRDSLFDVDTLWERAVAVSRLLAHSAEERAGLRRFATPPLLERIDADEAARSTGQTNVRGGWHTTEIHVAAREIASSVRRAVAARGIGIVHGRAERVSARDRAWRTSMADGSSIVSDTVVNCLWESRSMIDRQVAPPSAEEPPVSIRYKRSLFGTDTGREHMGSTTRILGGFGDIVSYANGDAYLSWYPTGLAGRTETGSPPPIQEPDLDSFIEATLTGLDLPLDTVARRGSWQVGGGYIVARGSGDIDDPRTLLHTRDRAGVKELCAGYLSIDTGKYTTGPWLATLAADVVAARLGRPNATGIRPRAASA
jgi:hypothetical protein